MTDFTTDYRTLSDAERDTLADAGRDRLDELAFQPNESGALGTETKRLNREDEHVAQTVLRTG